MCLYFFIPNDRGIDVLHKKSELAKELEKRKEREKSIKHQYERKNSFDVKMQEMANKVKMVRNLFIRELHV